MSSGTIIWSMAGTKKIRVKMQSVAFAVAIQRIIGQAIGHGYQDGRIEKQEPDEQCKAFTEELVNEFLSSYTEWVERIIGSDERGRVNEAALTRNALRHKQRARNRKTIGALKRDLPHLLSENRKIPRRAD
jgi:hypothetical protein